MIPMPFVKASSITHLADARYFASHQVKMMGFCFDPQSPDYLEPYNMQLISGWIEGPLLVGEFDHLSLAAISDIVQSLQLDYVQLTLSLAPACRKWLPAVPYIFEIGPESLANLNSVEELLKNIYQPGDFVLINLRHTNIDEAMPPDYDKIKHLCATYSAIIDYPFTAENIFWWIGKFQPAGISIKGQPLTQPGIRLYETTDLLFEKLENNL